MENESARSEKTMPPKNLGFVYFQKKYFRSRRDVSIFDNTYVHLKPAKVMSENIGTKIKRLREERGLSPAELSALSSVHETQLQLIEQGGLSPSVTTLVHIARALGTRLGTILDGTEQLTPVMTKGDPTPTVSISSSDMQTVNHLKYFALAQDKSDRNMEPLLIDVEYTDPAVGKLSHHEGEEFLYVIEGKAELRYGSHTYPLKKGDSIYFDSLVPHCLSTPAEGEKARVLAVTYAPF